MTSDKSPGHLFSPYLTDYSSPSTPVISTNPGSNAGKGVSRRRDEFWVEDGRDFYRPVTIGALPDDALLEIFSFYVEEAYEDTYYFDLFYSQVRPLEAWNILTHVCQRWRGVVFASPRRLNLRLLCRSTRPVSKMQEIWPTLPIFVEHWHGTRTSGHEQSLDENVIAALKHTDRICEIQLLIKSHSLYHRCSTMMQETFLNLKKLNLCFSSDVESAPALPNSFLGGSAPRLRSLFLRNIPFPALPKLLLSTTDLVFLQVWEIPHSGYISPEAMVTCLSSLIRLEHLSLHFESPRSRPARPSRRLSSLTRIDLPALTHFHFHGVNEYIEYMMARINAPLLVEIRVRFFNHLLFDMLELAQFSDRGEIFKVHRHAAVVFWDEWVDVGFFPSDLETMAGTCIFSILSTRSEWQLSSLADICSSFLSPSRLSSLERLDIAGPYIDGEHWDNDMEDIQWLELLQPFVAVKDLYLCKELALRLPWEMQELTDETSIEVLPALQRIFVQEDQVSGTAEEAIRPFIAARQLSGHPVAVHHWQPVWERYSWEW